MDLNLNYISIIISLLAIIVTITISYSIIINTVRVKQIAKETAENSVKKIVIRTNGLANYCLAIIELKDEKTENALNIAKIALKMFIQISDKEMITKCNKLIERIKKQL
jgi:uncharacterized membrane protein